MEHITKLMNRIDGHNLKIRLCPYFYTIIYPILPNTLLFWGHNVKSAITGYNQQSIFHLILYTKF